PWLRVNDDGRTDAALLAAAARGGDEAAFAMLVRRHIRAGTLLAAQFLGARNDAEDVVQEAFTVVWKQAHRFDPDRPFAPWFLRSSGSWRRTDDRAILAARGYCVCGGGPLGVNRRTRTVRVPLSRASMSE